MSCFLEKRIRGFKQKQPPREVCKRGGQLIIPEERKVLYERKARKEQ